MRQGTSTKVITSKLQSGISESQRLVSTLEYYDWLSDHGICWSQVCGILKLENEVRVSRFKTATDLKLSLKLRDGTVTELPWPPFSDDVIFNRKKTTDDRRTN